MALQRQPDGLIVGHHLLRQRHQRQGLRLLVRLLARGGDFEQRQRHVIGQPPHRPQCGAAIEPDGAKRIGIRQQDQRALGQPGVAGEILQRGERAALPRGDDALGPVVALTTVIPGHGRSRIESRNAPGRSRNYTGLRRSTRRIPE